MEFRDRTLPRIKKDNVNGVVKLVVEYLCGVKYYATLSNKEKNLVTNLIQRMQTEGIDWAQFNEFLLLLNQDRVSEAFFRFFFGGERIKLEELKKGITKFRGFALLCFGNFRFAYNQLSRLNEKKLEEGLQPYCRDDGVLRKFTSRPSKALEIAEIEKNKTWFNGYLTKKKMEKAAELLSNLLESKSPNPYGISIEVLLEISAIYQKLGRDLNEIERKALTNTDIYLTWDYMDVYVATSMRHRWEFEETYVFIKEVFGDRRLETLDLRYFDPTQSGCENRIDKGLIEGLMLKRADCTIYMAQEVDTMGKDSELAATLAQRKPVIAYIPQIDIAKHTEKIKEYPLDYLKLRSLVLKAEGIFDDNECKSKLIDFADDFQDSMNNFIEELDNYRINQPFSLWTEKENDFKSKSKYFESACSILSIAEYFSYEKRASTLVVSHPLSLQVDLQTGVANGVLVVRSSKQCAELLHKILDNSLEFTIKKIKEQKSSVTILEEKISKCPYRVVTDYEKLSNSFWNFYLNSYN